MIKKILLITSIYTGSAFPLLGTLWQGVKTATHWGIAAGPTWYEAYNYATLLSDKAALEQFGNEPLPCQDDRDLRVLLKELGVTNSATMGIYQVNGEVQDYVQTAITSTDSLLFVNGLYYDDLTTAEKKAALSQALTMLNNKHTLINTLVLAALPIITHLGTEYYTKGVNSLLPDTFKEHWLSGKLVKAHNFLATFCVTKSIINGLLASAYFKNQAKRYDLKAAHTYKTAADLISYYTKLEPKIYKDLDLLGLRQPTLHERTKYLATAAQ